MSDLYLLHFESCKYVVKKNEPGIIKSESEFLHCYKENKLLPKIFFTEQSYEYIVYSFIDGTTEYVEGSKKENLKVLVEGLLNHYKPVSSCKDWGWMDEPTSSWKSFMKEEVGYARKILDYRLDDSHYYFMLNLIEKNNKERIPYLLHGDCGIHNFIFHNGQLKGVIDPTPVIGEPLYDLIYAFCSSADELTKETIEYAVSFFHDKSGINNSLLYEEVLVGLYLRLATSVKHQPTEFNKYFESWHYWLNIIKNI